ncbi:MAG TPA: thermopsin family protease [Thermoplasmata archaeon]|nr:thermopsin family protease [Thermoplasmata archaeon]
MAGRGSWGERTSLFGIVGLVAILLLPSATIGHPGPSSSAPAPILGPSEREPVAGGVAPRLGAATYAPSGVPGPTGIGPSDVPRALLTPHPSIVNPLRTYSREPAPMGIADFGVTGTSPGASAYEYSSPIFQGQAVVRSLSVSIGGTTSKVTAFELNAVVLLQWNGTNYSYWIQNGLHLDAGSDEFTIGGAYVWNFSAPGAMLRPGELSGNAGSVLASDTYYDIPGCGPTYSGQCTTLSLPATLTGRIITSTSTGIPFVAYQYDLGSGWVTYDNVSFPHLTNARDEGFRVDGFAPTPYAAGANYDAEWVWVGAGGGSASTDQGSDINLTLSFWNEHNYQAVPTAWNFGSNTGETSSNVTEVGSDPLGAHLASGPGTLGVLYNRSGVGFLNLSVPTTGPATVLVDGRATSFGLGWANVTLPVGAHSLDLQDFANSSAAFTVLAGATTFVNLSGAGELTFHETGLPNGTSWGVTVNGTLRATSGQNLSWNLANGTYPVMYPAVPGYVRVGLPPASVTLPGPSQVSLDFVPFDFNVTFTESGLPPSTPWWVNASGHLVRGAGTSLPVAAPNGSTPYEVGSLYEFLASPGTGTILVSAGVATPGAVTFSYRPTFVVGTVAPADAVVSIGGVVQEVAGSGYSDSVIPGSYALVASASGYSTVRLNVTATPGNVTWENLTLVANQTPTSGNPPAPSGGTGISPLIAGLVVAAVAAAATLAVVVLARRKR